MKYLQIYEKFNNSSDDTLYIFDLDDTLAQSPKFEDLAIEFLKEETSIKSLLNRSVKCIGKNLKDLKWENGRIFVNDPNEEIEIKRNWIRKKSRVYLISPDRFYYTDMSLPNKLLKTSDIYKSVKNKAIVTGRIISVKHKIEERIKDIGLEYPNFGLYCYPSTLESSNRVGYMESKNYYRIN